MEGNLKCFNCNSPFVLEGEQRKKHSSQRLPLLLRCGHCYCSVCVSTTLTKAASIPCPECSVQTPITQGVGVRSQLPLSVYTVGLIKTAELALQRPLFVNNGDSSDKDETISQNESEPEIGTVSLSVPECDECEINSAQVKCEKCDCIYCDSCFDLIHSRSKTLRLHKKVEYSDTPMGSEVQSAEYQQMVERAKTEGNHLSKLLDVVAAAQSKALDSGAQSLEACRMGVWHLHRKLEASLAVIEDQYNGEERRVKRDNRRLINDIMSTRKHLQVKAETQPSPHLYQQFLTELEEAIARAHKLREACTRGRGLKVTVKSLNDVDIAKTVTVETSELQIPKPIVSQGPELHINSVKQSPIRTPTRSPSKVENGTLIKSDNSSKSNLLSPAQSRHRTPSSRGSSPQVDSVDEEDLKNATGCNVIHVESPSEFWIQLLEDVPKLKTVNELLKAHCNTRNKEPLLEIGTVCGMRKREGDWVRGVIERISWGSPGYTTLQLIDYGYTDIASMGSLCSIPDQWQRMSPLAYKCGLGGVRPPSLHLSVVPSDWSQNTVSYFRSVTLKQQELKVKILSREREKGWLGEVLLVDLYLPSISCGGVSMCKQLVQQGKAVYVRERPLQSGDLPIGPIPPVGTQLDVVMITAQSPLDFFVQPANDSSILDNIIHLITVYVAGGNQPIPASRVAVNALVLAPYDESYYRAKIIGLSDDTAQVKYLDYGNEAKVGVADLYEMTRRLARMPPACYHCYLVGAQGKKWTEELCDDFYTITNGDSLRMVVMGTMVGGVLPVSLLYGRSGKDVGTLIGLSPRKQTPPSSPQKQTPPPNSKSPAKEHISPSKQLFPPPGLPRPLSQPTSPFLITTPTPSPHPLAPPTSPFLITTPTPSPHPLAPPTPSLPHVGYKGPVIVKHVQDPLHFHVVLKEKLPIFKQIETRLPVTSPSPFVPKAGQYCHALFDYKYHRGRVQSVSKDGTTCEVYYLDYGNTEDVPTGNLLPLPPDLCSEGPLAIPCQLEGAELGTPYDYSKNMEFYQLVFEKELMAVVKGVELAPPSLIITLYVTGSAGPVDILTVLDHTHSSHNSSLSNSLSCTPRSGTPPTSDTPTSSSCSKSPSLKEGVVFGGSHDRRPTPLRYLPSVLPSEGQFPVIVTFIDDSNVIFGQPLSFTHLFEEVDESVTMVTEKFRPVSTLGEMLVGQGGVAQFQDDGRWYRATVVTIDGDSAEVYFVDFGNGGVVKSHQIIAKLVAPSVPQLALAFPQYSDLSKETLMALIDKELLAREGPGGVVTLTFNGEKLQEAIFRLQPLPPSSPSIGSS